MTVEVLKARENDFEAIYPVLASFRNSDLTKNDWKKLFKRYWSHQEDYVGYCLKENEEIVGFLGMILVRRGSHKFCNLTSWIVKPEYRGKGFLLLSKVMQLKDYTMFTLTANLTSYKIFKRRGFRDLNRREYLLSPAFLKRKEKKFQRRVSFDFEIMENKLNEKDLVIFKEHQQFNCLHVLVETEDGRCYFVVKKSYVPFRPFNIINRISNKLFSKNIMPKKLVLGSIEYVGNCHLFARHINHIVMRVCLKYKVFGLTVSDRFIDPTVVKIFKFYKPQQAFQVYKSSFLDAKDIDSLYSEEFILHARS